MFCPKCKAEFREGFQLCSDCEIKLVDRLPNEPPADSEYVEYRELLVTTDPAKIAMIKSLFESEDINYYFHGENLTSMLPTSALTTKLMVQSDQVEDALDILRVLKQPHIID